MKSVISFPLVYCTSFVQYELGIISKKITLIWLCQIQFLLLQYLTTKDIAYETRCIYTSMSSSYYDW